MGFDSRSVVVLLSSSPLLVGERTRAVVVPQHRHASRKATPPLKRWKVATVAQLLALPLPRRCWLFFLLAVKQRTRANGIRLLCDGRDGRCRVRANLCDNKLDTLRALSTK